ncbi:hypothetical protein GCM10025762_33630 [Haloechinothrix salitolerans]
MSGAVASSAQASGVTDVPTLPERKEAFMSQQGYTWRRRWDGHGGQADDGTTVAIQVGVIEVAAKCPW